MKLRNKITISLLFFAIIYFFGFTSQLASGQSNYTANYDYLLWLTTIGSILVGILVFALMIYFIYKYREDKVVERKHTENESKYESMWIGLAIILVVILIGASSGILLSIQTDEGWGVPSDDAIELKVEAVPFYWIIRDANNDYINWTDDSSESRPHHYRNIDHKLNLDVGVNYKLNLTGLGVIHSFFAYGLDFKIDAIPGQFNIFYFTITEPGEFIVVCTEFCGTFHYNMKFTIVAS